MNEMLEFNFRNASTNISIPNHISNHNDHFGHHKIITKKKYLVCLLKKTRQKSKMILLGSIIKVNEVCIAI